MIARRGCCAVVPASVPPQTHVCRQFAPSLSIHTQTSIPVNMPEGFRHQSTGIGIATPPGRSRRCQAPDVCKTYSSRDISTEEPGRNTTSPIARTPRCYLSEYGTRVSAARLAVVEFGVQLRTVADVTLSRLPGMHTTLPSHRIARGKRPDLASSCIALEAVV